MKFKVGDKVCVKKDLKIDKRYDGLTYTRTMHDRYSTEVLIIDEICTSFGGWYHVKGDNDKYGWNDVMLEPAPFTKSDLKDGMVVETRDGYLYLVIGNRVHGKLLYGFLNDWIDDLTNPASSDLDIVKIYTVTDGATDISSILNYRNLKPVWVRKEEPECVELTIEEIEKELGYKIKVVGDSSCQK